MEEGTGVIEGFADGDGDAAFVAAVYVLSVEPAEGVGSDLLLPHPVIMVNAANSANIHFI